MTVSTLARNAFLSKKFDLDSVITMLPTGDFSFFDEVVIEDLVPPAQHHVTVTSDDGWPSFTIIVRSGASKSCDKHTSLKSTNWRGWRADRGTVVNLRPRKSRIETLAHDWLRDTKWDSSFHRIMRHPSFDKLRAAGDPAVSYAISKLREGDLQMHWFILAKSISGVDPTPPQSRGRLPEMARHWLEWYDSQVGRGE